MVKDVEVDKGSGVVEIEIEDNGIGINADKLPYVFDRFYQVYDTSRGNHKGSGLGLSMVNELVKLHYGSINVTSKRGYGTTFSIHLPYGKDHLKADSPQNDPPVHPFLVIG